MSNNHELLVKGNLTLKDIKTYSNHHSKKMATIYFFVYLVLALVFLNMISSNVLFIGISTLCLSIIGVLTVKISSKIVMIREYKSNSFIKLEVTYIISNDGINQKSVRSETYYEWTDIRVACERKEMFLLYVSRNKAIVLPKRFFISNEDIDLFRNIVSENMDKAKVKF